MFAPPRVGRRVARGAFGRRGRKTERQQGEAEDRLPGRVRRPAQVGESLERRDHAGGQESDHRGGAAAAVDAMINEPPGRRGNLPRGGRRVDRGGGAR